MAKPQVAVLSWHHAIPRVSTQTLTIPYEGLYELGRIVDSDISPAQAERIHKRIDKWESNLTAELDRIDKEIAKVLASNPDEFSREAADRVQWLVNRLRGTKAKQRQREIMIGYLLGRRVERMGVVPMETFVVSGHKAKVLRPKRMRDEKAKKIESERRKRRRRSEEALEWAKQKFPTAAADGKISFLKQKAAEHLNINIGTLNRRLRHPK